MNEAETRAELIDPLLAHVAYALPPVPRELCAQQARLYIHSRFSSKQHCSSILSCSTT